MFKRILRWGAPATYVGIVLLVGLSLVAVLTRSPDTRSNFQDSPGTYDRTDVALVGVPHAFEGLRDKLGPSPQEFYVGAGCANCHGLSGEGGTVGPDIWKVNTQDMLDVIRKGGHGMPSFDSERLTDDEVATLSAYLNDLRKQAETSAGGRPGS